MGSFINSHKPTESHGGIGGNVYFGSYVASPSTNAAGAQGMDWKTLAMIGMAIYVAVKVIK